MSPNSIGVGASGAIFGVVGSFAAFFLVRRHVFGALGKQNLYGILVLAAINLFFGLITPGIDNWAHMGGFAAGFFVGYILVPKFPVKVSNIKELNFDVEYTYEIIGISNKRICR